MSGTDEDALASAKERGWRRVAELDEAHARGELDDAAWHREMAAAIVPAYLAGDERGASGHSGSAEDWEWSRGTIAALIDRDGGFLDIGCANGLLMESVARWSAARGLRVEPHGLEIAPELAALARRRLPDWAGRIHVGNAMGWLPPRRYELVRTGLEYVPPVRRRELVAWLLDEVVAPGGRLIVGKFNEEVDAPTTEQALARWGFEVAARVQRAHRGEPRLAYRALAIDAPRRGDDPGFRALRRADLPLLQRWLAAPHIDRWWRAGTDAIAGYAARIEGREPTYVHAIVVRGQPVGWIQRYRWADHPEHAAQLGAGAGEAGLDLAIGEPGLLGQGLGTRVLREFVEQVIFADPAITACVCDPEADNVASLRAFEKAGFAVVRTVRLVGETYDRRVVRRVRDGA